MLRQGFTLSYCLSCPACWWEGEADRELCLFGSSSVTGGASASCPVTNIYMYRWCLTCPSPCPGAPYMVSSCQEELDEVLGAEVGLIMAVSREDEEQADAFLFLGGVVALSHV